MVNFGRKTDGVQKWHDHSGNADSGGFIIGHHCGIIGLLVRRATSWVCLPYISRLITGQKSPSWIADGNNVRMANFWDHALGLCREMCLTVHWPLIVVADAYFSKAPFINGMKAMKAVLISRLREDAVGWTPDEPPTDNKQEKKPSLKDKEKIRLAQLLKSLPVQTATICLYGKPQWVEYVSAQVYLRNVNDRVLVVVVKTAAKPLILLSTATFMKGEDIIELYGARFAIEGAIRDLKSEMGLNDYQQTSTSGFFRFVNLTCLAYSLWRTVAFICSPTLWEPLFQKKPYVSRTSESIGFIREVLRQIAVKTIINVHFAPRANLKKKSKLYQDLFRLAA